MSRQVQQTDDVTTECLTGDHDRCSGYTEPEWDAELCLCQCHDDRAAQIAGDR